MSALWSFARKPEAGVFRTCTSQKEEKFCDGIGICGWSIIINKNKNNNIVVIITTTVI